ncbi:unnamed protein product [Phytophthora fragariaefolia]|uniref:Unnamed protein product n=1 Tax=Phytophthora fragariaefolia TaxID=1490495 RepID=A0A9W7D4Q8_9STRA|nr:unnamed protein product [Phytophthora fragariaefolia]
MIGYNNSALYNLEANVNYTLLTTRSIVVLTRHSTLAWLVNSTGSQGRLGNWAALLSEWTLEIRKCSKGEDEFQGVIAASITPRAEVDEALIAIAPVKEPRQTIVLPPPTVEEDERLLVASFDGGERTKRNSGAYSAIIWRLPEWTIVSAASGYSPDLTVNEAEYRGLLLGFDLLATMDRRRIMICGDSNLVIRQMRGEIACKAPGLQLLRRKALDRLSGWPNHDFLHMKREWNQSADKLASEALQQEEGVETPGRRVFHGCAGDGSVVVPIVTVNTSQCLHLEEPLAHVFARFALELGPAAWDTGFGLSWSHRLDLTAGSWFLSVLARLGGYGCGVLTNKCYQYCKPAKRTRVKKRREGVLGAGSRWLPIGSIPPALISANERSPPSPIGQNPRTNQNQRAGLRVVLQSSHQVPRSEQVEMVVKASEIAPAAYAAGSTSSVQKEDDLSYDLGNLAAFDMHPFAYQSEKELALHARENVQLLVNHIFELPREMSDMGPLAQLPEPVTVIPREKPLPKPKVETRWEKFAKEKGIDKRKKSRKVFDEATGEWSHAWGYQRAGDDMKDWAVEVKQGDMDDPWTKRKQEKRARVDKNLRAQANNLKHGRGKQLAGIDGRTPAGIPVELMNTDDAKAKQRGKNGTSKTLEKVQFSTASMGKFDKMRDGESERKIKGKRNHFLPTTGAETTEKERSMNALKRVLGREENAGKNKGKSFDDDEDGEGGKRKKKGKKLKNITKGAAKKRRTK